MDKLHLLKKMEKASKLSYIAYYYYIILAHRFEAAMGLNISDFNFYIISDRM